MYDTHQLRAAFARSLSAMYGTEVPAYTQLGRSGLRVSRLVLGTMNFGPQTQEADAHAIMDAALEAGVNVVDTANVYGGAEHRGWTEEIIGRWLSSSGRRDEVVLATKVYGDMSGRPNDAKLSALNIRRAVEASLRRLQTDHIDLYPVERLLPACPPFKEPIRGPTAQYACPFRTCCRESPEVDSRRACPLGRPCE